MPEGYIFSSHVLTFANYTVLGRNWTLLEKFQTAYVDYCCNKLICGDTGTHTVKFCNVDMGQNKLRLGSITYQLCFRNEYDLIVCLCLSVCECVFNKLSFFFFNFWLTLVKVLTLAALKTDYALDTLGCQSSPQVVWCIPGSQEEIPWL